MLMQLIKGLDGIVHQTYFLGSNDVTMDFPFPGDNSWTIYIKAELFDMLMHLIDGLDSIGRW